MTTIEPSQALLKARDLVDWMKASKGKPCHRAVVDSFPSIVAELERLHAENVKVTKERDEVQRQEGDMTDVYLEEEYLNQLKTLKAENQKLREERDQLVRGKELSFDKGECVTGATKEQTPSAEMQKRMDHIEWIEELVVESLSCQDCEWCAEKDEYCDSCKWKIDFTRSIHSENQKLREGYTGMREVLGFYGTASNYTTGDIQIDNGNRAIEALTSFHSFY